MEHSEDELTSLKETILMLDAVFKRQNATNAHVINSLVYFLCLTITKDNEHVDDLRYMIIDNIHRNINSFIRTTKVVKDGKD